MSLARGNHRSRTTDESWPYPDAGAEFEADDEIDLDLLELRVDPRAYADLTPGERAVLFLRFGMADGVAHSIRDIGHNLELTATEASDVLGSAVDKVRTRLAGVDLIA